jgi:calcineurin-like phosphoesterase family protein
MEYFTSDTHFGHKKMLEYCGRPKDFEQKIYKGFRLLKENDVLYHLGDVCMGNDIKWHAMYIQTLPCKKILIRGNHDCKSDAWYLAHGWDAVFEGVLLKREGKQILLSHEPLFCPPHVVLNIHGHLHNKIDGETSSKYKLISLERTNYQLSSLKSLIYFLN